MPRSFAAVFAFVICAISTTTTNADLVSFVDDFSNTDSAVGTTQPANWDLLTGNSTFVLESGDGNDDDELDETGDGYATLRGNVTDNGGNFVPMVSRDIGVVMASDIGSEVNLLMDFLEVNQGASYTGGLFLDGTDVASFSSDTFGGNLDSAVIDVTYTVTAADVGSTLAAKFQYFTNSDERAIGLDAVNVSVTSAVPEPSSALLILGLAGLAGVIRNRR